MRLDYNVPIQSVEPEETVVQDSSYFSPKASDKYSLFINLQQTANKVLNKAEPNVAQPKNMYEGPKQPMENVD